MLEFPDRLCLIINSVEFRLLVHDSNPTAGSYNSVYVGTYILGRYCIVLYIPGAAVSVYV